MVNPVARQGRFLRVLATALMAAGLAAAALGPAAAADGPALTAPEALALSREGQITIIDVRRPQEWRQTGLPAGAIGVPLGGPSNGGAFLARVEEATGGDKDDPIALICARGGRSSRAAILLRRQGYRQVYDISEGMLGSGGAPGWLARGLPLRACERC